VLISEGSNMRNESTERKLQIYSIWILTQKCMLLQKTILYILHLWISVLLLWI